jgi:hypothetical protein
MFLFIHFVIEVKWDIENATEWNLNTNLETYSFVVENLPAAIGDSRIVLKTLPGWGLFLVEYFSCGLFTLSSCE